MVAVTNNINKGSFYPEYSSPSDSLWKQAIYAFLLPRSNTVVGEGWKIFHDAMTNDSRRWYLTL